MQFTSFLFSKGDVSAHATVAHLTSAETKRAVTLHNHVIIHVKILSRIDMQGVLQAFFLQGSLSHLVISYIIELV